MFNYHLDLFSGDRIGSQPGVKSGRGATGKRRIALGNTVALPCVIEAIRRVKYLESLIVA